MAGEKSFDVEEAIFTGALDHFEEVFHAGDFLELLFEEPIEKSFGDVIGFLEAEIDEGIDVLGDLFFLVEGKLDGLLDGFEGALGSWNGGNLDLAAGVEDVFNEAHGMVAFLLGLPGKML